MHAAITCRSFIRCDLYICEGSSTSSPYGDWLRALAHKATNDGNKTTNNATKSIKVHTIKQCQGFVFV